MWQVGERGAVVHRARLREPHIEVFAHKVMGLFLDHFHNGFLDHCRKLLLKYLGNEMPQLAPPRPDR